MIRRMRRAALAVVVAGSMLAIAGPAFAADDAGEATASSPALGGSELAIVIVVLVAAAVLSLAMMLWFNRDALRRYYDTASELARGGIKSTPVEIPGQEPEELTAKGEAAKPISMKGPAATVVGSSAEYEVVGDPKPGSATWSLEPEQAGALNPKEGVKITLTPAKAGVWTLKADAGGGRTAEMNIAVTDPPSEIKLPFVGRGYGTIALGIVAIFAVMGLGLAGVLGGEAIATLFGGLVGVGAARAASSQSDS